MKKCSYIISSIGLSTKLEELIKLLTINLSDDELILVDNSEKGILKEKYFNNSKIKYVHEENKGSSNARNRGASESKNELLIFMDDDIIPSTSFFKKLKKYKEIEYINSIIGGKIIVNNIPKYIPSKYDYFVGKKDFGSSLITLPKYSYLGGCLLIVDKEAFITLGGFNNKFGHNGNEIGSNEDVLFQDIARKNKFNVIYDPEIACEHFWNGSKDTITKKIAIQGISDCLLDKKHHKIRGILKLIKYVVFINIKKKSQNINDKFDVVRYKKYVETYINK